VPSNMPIPGQVWRAGRSQDSSISHATELCGAGQTAAVHSPNLLPNVETASRILPGLLFHIETAYFAGEDAGAGGGGTNSRSRTCQVVLCPGFSVTMPVS